MSDGEKKQIEGVCTEISEKNGWTSFAIDVGTQYPVRLSTKLPALIEQGRAAGQQRAVWSFKESQGGENPNKPGTHYTNRYLDGVEVGGSLTEAAASVSHPQAQTASSSPVTNQHMPDKVKQHVIVRQACLKAAATIVAADVASGNMGLDDDGGTNTISLAARFEAWVYRDVDEIPF